MSVTDRVRELVLPILADRQLDLYDVELAGGVLRVVVNRAGGLDLDALSDATRAVSRALDEADPVSSRYTLEVTSPGLERALRTPEHFAAAIGETIKVKTAPGVESERRIQGVLAAANGDGITVQTGVGETGEPTLRRLAYDDVARARTVFEWGPGTSDEKRERRS